MGKLDRAQALMGPAIRDGLVTGYQPLIASLHMLDRDDRHVLAAAINCVAPVVVTWNSKDFPRQVLAEWNIEAKTPDDFMVDQLHLDSGAVHAALQQMADIRRMPRMTVADVIDDLEHSGLAETAIMLRHSANETTSAQRPVQATRSSESLSLTEINSKISNFTMFPLVRLCGPPGDRTPNPRIKRSLALAA